MSTTSPEQRRRHEWERLVELRWWLIGAVALAGAVLAGGRGDWDLFVIAARDLMSHDVGLGVFVAHRDVQTGPLTLLATWVLSYLPGDGFAVSGVVVVLLGMWSLLQIDRAAAARWPDRLVQRTCTLIGGLVVMALWGQLSGFGHLDDAVVLAIAVRCSVARDRALVRAVLVGLAVGVKPWAVVLAPLALDWPFPTRASSGAWARWATPGALAAAVGAVCWLPFVIHSPDTTASLKPSVSLADDSVLLLLGLRTADVPAAVRLAQLVGALAVATWCCARGRRAAAVMAALAVRMATDLGTWAYYTPGLLVATLTFDLLVRRRMVPLLTLATFVLLPLPWMIDSADLRAALRLLACVTVVAVAVSGRAPSADRCCPSSDPAAVG